MPSIFIAGSETLVVGMTFGGGGAIAKKEAIAKMRSITKKGLIIKKEAIAKKGAINKFLCFIQKQSYLFY